MYEKYLSLARDAHSSGDRIASESYYQFAEHYFRIMNDSTDPQRNAQPPRAAQEQPPSRTAPVKQARGNQEQPHVEWPIQVDGVNGSPADQPEADQRPARKPDAPSAEEPVPPGDGSEPPRRSVKPRQRTRRRPTNGSGEKDAKPEAATDDDAASAASDQGGSDKAKPLD